MQERCCVNVGELNIGYAGGVWVVATEWRVSSGDPHMFRFLCFYE